MINIENETKLFIPTFHFSPKKKKCKTVTEKVVFSKQGLKLKANMIQNQ